MAASDNQALRDTETLDPTLFTTAFKRNRFFMFTQREPDAYVTSKCKDLINDSIFTPIFSFADMTTQRETEMFSTRNHLEKNRPWLQLKQSNN